MNKPPTSTWLYTGQNTHKNGRDVPIIYSRTVLRDLHLICKGDEAIG